MRKEPYIIGKEPEARVIHHVEGYTTLSHVERYTRLSHVEIYTTLRDTAR